MPRPRKNAAPEPEATQATAVASSEAALLNTLVHRLELAGFTHRLDLHASQEGMAAALVWGMHRGEETPRVLALVQPPGAWSRSNAEDVMALSWTLPTPDTPANEFAQFAVVVDATGQNEVVFDLSPGGAHEIDRLPALNEIGEYKRIKEEPTRRWSMRMYERLMKGFNALHERIYQTHKDKVNGKNDIIEEVAKLLFLETFRLHHDGAKLLFSYKGIQLNLKDIFTAEHIRRHSKEAVAQIQAAFEHFKGDPDYVVTDDEGERHPIFDDKVHLRLTQPGNYEAVLSLIQELGPVTGNAHREDRPEIFKAEGTLRDIAADVLGRAFDVFLRANFESKGGLGIYLTPAPVKQAMLDLAFHDIRETDIERLTARDADGHPAFRFCDPTCGSGGFLSLTLGHVRRTLDELGGLTDQRRRELFEQMCEHSFIGADSSPQMVMLARVTMALLGAPKARIFYTQDSRTTPQLHACTFDLICTNPPFGTPKFNKGQEAARRAHEEAMEQILATFRTDLSPRGSRADRFDYSPSVTGMALGGVPDNKGVWKPASTNTDPAVLFIDRCLQLLKPGGRLLIVLPDGVLCNSGERYVREYIMGRKDEATGQFHGGKAIVKGVISLPSDTFKLSGTGAKTSVLYLQKRRARTDDPERFQDEPQTDVFMAVAETLGYVVKNNVEDYGVGVPNDLAAITGAYVRGE